MTSNMESDKTTLALLKTFRKELQKVQMQYGKYDDHIHYMMIVDKLQLALTGLKIFIKTTLQDKLDTEESFKDQDEGKDIPKKEKDKLVKDREEKIDRIKDYQKEMIDMCQMLEDEFNGLSEYLLKIDDCDSKSSCSSDDETEVVIGSPYEELNGNYK